MPRKPGIKKPATRAARDLNIALNNIKPIDKKPLSWWEQFKMWLGRKLLFDKGHGS